MAILLSMKSTLSTITIHESTLSKLNSAKNEQTEANQVGTVVQSVKNRFVLGCVKSPCRERHPRGRITQPNTNLLNKYVQRTEKMFVNFAKLKPGRKAKHGQREISRNHIQRSAKVSFLGCVSRLCAQGASHAT